MTTDQDLPEGGAPRVRRDGPGGLHIMQGRGSRRTAGQITPYWRLVGDNGEILGHSQAYASMGNAARGADAAERTVIRNAHDAGPELFEVLQRMDALVHGAQTGRADLVEFRQVLDDLLEGPGIPVDPATRREHLLDLAAIATHYAHELTEGGES